MSHALATNAIDHAPTVRAWLDKIKELSDEREKDAMSRARLSNLKVNKFRQVVTTELEKGGGLLQLFRALERYRDESGAPYSGDAQVFGYNSVMERWPFSDKGGEIDYFASQYASNMAVGEDRAFVDSIKERLVPSSATSAEELTRIVTEFAKGREPFAIAVGRRFDKLHAAGLIEWEREEQQESDMPATVERLFGVRVYHSWAPDRHAPTLLLLDRKHLGCFVRHNPADSGTMVETSPKWLLLDVLEFEGNDALTTKLIQAAPPWLGKIDGETRQREHLKTRVWLKLLERVTFDPESGFYGLAVTWEPKEDTREERRGSEEQS